MSVSAFHHNFKSVTSTSPLQYLKTYRLHKARMLMIHDGMKASAAAMRVGYESASQFSREFKRYFGVTPGEMRHASEPCRSLTANVGRVSDSATRLYYALQYFFLITTAIVPTSPATSRNIGSTIRKVITVFMVLHKQDHVQRIAESGNDTTHNNALSQLKNWKRRFDRPEMPAMVGSRVRTKARKRPASKASRPCLSNMQVAR